MPLWALPTGYGSYTLSPMGFKVLLSNLDLGRVTEAINQAVPGMLVFDLEDARDVVWAALEYFLERDVERWKGRWDVEQYVHNDVLKATYDLLTPDTIVDWKIIDGETEGTNWDKKKARYLRSWQPKVYLSMAPEKVFEFRFVSRMLNQKDPIKYERLKWQPWWWRRLGAAVEYCKHLPYSGQPWLANWASCDGWNGRCEYYADCHGGHVPQQPLQLGLINKTMLDTVGDCAEKARRMLLAGGTASNSTMRFGTAVHAGLAEAYRQLRQDVGA